ncbi:MAG: protein-disulfide reductase DsbD [Ostreibacterium sp.]
MRIIQMLIVWLGLFLGVGQVWALEILPANEVFIPTVTAVSDETITLDIKIKPDYYLYRERLFSVKTTNNNIELGQITLSQGSEKTDRFFGTQSIWSGGKNHATITLNYKNPRLSQSAVLVLKYQGCQENVICYPPEQIKLPIDLPVASANDNLFQVKSIVRQGLLASSSVISGVSTNKIALFRKTNADNLLSEDDAFSLNVVVIDKNTLSLRWRVADGYYLYRDKTQVIADKPIAKITYSVGQLHSDDFFGEQVIYRGKEAEARVYLKTPTDYLTMDIVYQGCADKGICYPEMKRRISVVDGSISSPRALQSDEKLMVNNNDSGNNAVRNDDKGSAAIINRLTEVLKNNSWIGVGLLLLAGIALSFTPCVLPMLPILLGIITNQRQMKKSRAAVLSSAYALGVAVMMAVFGLVVAQTGLNIQIIFQKPIWLIIFSTIFIIMGLAMLGVFTVTMPGKVQRPIIRLQNHFQKATVGNLFIVGALSTLVVGPCIAPPLIAVLAFISTTNDSVQGALYLFALGLGMSLPLVIFATFVTSVPKTGAFSHLITRVFAMLMFGVGLWLLSRLLPGASSLVLWGMFMLALAWLFWHSYFVKPLGKWLTRILSVVFVVIGIAWIVGGALGNSNVLKPFTQVVKLPFTYVNTQTELQKAIENSSQLVMLDLYADWCVSCQEIEHITFANPAVVAALSDFTLLKLDITDTNAEHRKVLSNLGLIGPPALLFFKGGKEITAERQIGLIDAETLTHKLKRLTAK